MPEKTVHGYNYKVRIWYPEAPEDKTEGTILAAYDEDLTKEIQARYPGVTYEIISKEPVLGDPGDLVTLERKKEKIGELYGIPIYKIDITETLTLNVEAPLEQIGIVIPPWFIDTYTTQELSVRGRKYLVRISNIEGRIVIDIGEYVGPGKVEDMYQRVFTYNLIKPGTAEIWIPFDAEMAKEAINKALLIDAEIRSKSQVNPGPDELQFKAPLARGEQFMNELRRYGYDVGHDADYEDPNNYMTVIVRNVTPGRKRLLLDTAERWTVSLKEGNPGGKPSRLDVIRRVKPFMPLMQMQISGDLFRGEEGEYFTELFDRLAKTFETMPSTYQTEDTPTNDKIVYLHYFTSSSDWYIIEKDKLPEQHQAFGYAILNGDLQNAEWGYISIEELKAIPQVELDFYWTPKTFKEVMIEKNPAAIESDDLEPIPEHVKMDPNLLGNAIMHLAHAELIKIGVTSGGELRERGLYWEYESNFITTLQKVGIPIPLSQQVEERLTSLNYHTANEILTRRGYYPWKGPQPITENEKIAQESWDELEIKKRRDYLRDYVERQIPGAQDYYSQSWLGLSQEIRNFILTAYKK